MARVHVADVLMYHDVRDPESTAFPRRYRLRSFLSPARLRVQLDDIARAFAVVSLVDVAAALRGEVDLPPNAVALTFDDGLKDHYNVVLPLILDRGWPAAFFVPVAPVNDRRIMDAHKIQFILASCDSEAAVVAALFDLLRERRAGGDDVPADSFLWQTWSVSRWANSWWSAEMVFVTRFLREGLAPKVAAEVIDRLFSRLVTQDERAFAEELYLSPSDVRALADTGLTVGGHGVRSVNLAGLPTIEQEIEIAGSARFVRHVMGAERPWVFSYPNGGRDRTSLEFLAHEQCALAVSTRRGCASAGVRALDLPRFDGPQDLPALLEHCHGIPTAEAV
jgi:peptidoglycan/xylan/chitin deacetylase (PgdA/CDA1 family)